MSIRWFICVSWLAWATVAGARPATAQTARPATSAPTVAPASTSERRQASARFRKTMATKALAVAQLIDQGKAGEVWGKASVVMHTIISRQAFVAGVARLRGDAGKLLSRRLLKVYGRHSDGPHKLTDGTETGLPEGDYLNVLFLSRFAKQAQPMFELVSYHRDDNKVLRVSGYALAPVTPPTPGPQKP